MPELEEFHPGGNHEKHSGPIVVDAKGSQCPGPVMSLRDAMIKASIGDRIIMEVTDQGFKKDAAAWSEVTGNPMISMTDKDGVITAVFEKRIEIGKAEIPSKEDAITIIIFSEELDKGLAAFNIALGALAMGMKVEIFFTFWGLSMIRKADKPGLHKSMMGRPMEDMMPADDKSLPLSHKNLMGIGSRMMSRIMKDKNVPPLDFMLHLAKYDGVKFIACQMSMEILGIKQEELIDDVETGGVATMLEQARKSTVNYFI